MIWKKTLSILTGSNKSKLFYSILCIIIGGLKCNKKSTYFLHYEKLIGYQEEGGVTDFPFVPTWGKGMTPVIEIDIFPYYFPLLDTYNLKKN